jgi:recombination protein RecT
MTTPSGDVTTQAPIDAQVMQYAGEFALVLPPQMTPDYFTRLSVGLLRVNPTLKRAADNNPASLFAALLECARLGLTPGTSEVALVPRKGKNGRTEITCQPQWQGVVKRMLNTGRVEAVIAEAVFEGDEFTYQPGDATPTHAVDWFSDRGELVGAYAYARLTGGGVSKVAVVGPREIARAKASAQGVNRSDSPWVSDTPEMARKTAVHRLASWVPQSAEDCTRIPAAVADTATASERQVVAIPASPPPSAAVEAGPVDTSHLTVPAVPHGSDSDPVADAVTGEIIDGDVLDPGEE